MTLKRDDILAASDLSFVTIPVPDWGGSVCVRKMSGKERDAWEEGWRTFRSQKSGNEKDLRMFGAYLAIHAICDDQRRPIFTEADVDSLADKSARALSLIADVAMKLNGLASNDVETLLKNCEAGRTADGGSG